MVDAVNLANGTATVTAQIGNVKAFDKVTVAETLPTVTINKINGNDVIVGQVAGFGDNDDHEHSRRDEVSVGSQQWTDDKGHRHDHHQDSETVTLTGTVSGIAPHNTFRVTVHDGTFSKSFTASVNGSGNGWVATIPGRDIAELPIGTATVTAQVTDRYGNTSLPAVQHVTVKTSGSNSDSNRWDASCEPSTTRTVPDDPKASNATLAPTNLFNLADKDFGAASTLGYAMTDSNTNGLLAGSTDGNHLANVALLQQYISSSFVAPSDGHGGTLMSESPLTAHPLLSLPHG